MKIKFRYKANGTVCEFDPWFAEDMRKSYEWEEVKEEVSTTLKLKPKNDLPTTGKQGIS